MDGPAPPARFRVSRPSRRSGLRPRLLAGLTRAGAWVAIALCGLPLAGRAAEPADPSQGAPRPAPLAAAPAPRAFGESLVLRRCLVFTAKSIRDRQADLEHQDWVVLALENRCPVPVVNLHVELLLVDTQGRAYGKVFWLLGQGERLEAGGRWEDTVAVPDPDNRVARAWTLRVLRADTLTRGRAAPAPPRDAR